MITLGQIEETVKVLRRHDSEVKQFQAALDVEVARITKDATRHPDYIREKVAEARGKATPAIYETLGKINGLHKTLLKGAAPWKDKRFIMAARPLTEPLNSISGAPAKDLGVEAMARLAKMTEFSKLDADLLHAMAEDAKSEKRFAELHLLTLENNSRDQKLPGWKAIDLSDVVLDDQVKALELFTEANRIASGISIAMKQVEGKIASPIDRINAARGCPPPLVHPQPSGSPQDRMNAARRV